MENNKETFVRLWQKLERTRWMFIRLHKRYCIRRVVQAWYPVWATDERIADICRNCEQYGYNELPLPSLYPCPNREFLRALVSEQLGIGMRKVNVKALDEAYREVFPRSTPLNVAKKRR